MKATRSICTILISVFAACGTTSLSAQFLGSDFYNPFVTNGVLSSNTVFRPYPFTSRPSLFNADTGELRIGSVLAIGNDVDVQQVNNVILELADDGRFDLTSYDETVIPPELECTREEVLNAIPELTLDLSIAEAEELIGCLANYTSGIASLETGKRVSARWTGIDGAANSITRVAGDTWIPSGSYPTYSPSIWIGSSSNFPSSAPRISLNFLEGEKTSYSYSEGLEQQNCEQGEWLSILQKIEEGTTPDELNDQLGCEGALVNTTVFADSVETQYRWTLLETNSPGSQVGSFDVRSETAIIIFRNNEYESLNYSGTGRRDGISNCGVSDLTLAYETMREGYNEFVTVNQVPCEPDSVTTTINNGVTTTRYTWQTSIYPASLFESPNRSIHVVIVDGVADSIGFRRF